MRKVIYSMFMSVDGYIEDPGGSLEWGSIDEELHTYVNQQERLLGGYLYGRRLYETMSAFWPTADSHPEAEDYIVEYARIWQAMPKYVFSTTLQQVDWNATLVRGDLAQEVAKLKAGTGGDLALGGSDLAASFFRLGLIDMVGVYIHPVILGGGKPMFRAWEDRLHLRLVETHHFSSGVVYLSYENTQANPR